MIWGYPKNDLGTLHLVGNLTHPPVGNFLTTAIAEITVALNTWLCNFTAGT